MVMMAHCDLALPVFLTVFDLELLNFDGSFGAAAAALAAAALASDSSSTSGKTGGLPYSSISRFNLFAAAWIGMPVQWKPKGRRTFLPSRR